MYMNRIAFVFLFLGITSIYSQQNAKPSSPSGAGVKSAPKIPAVVKADAAGTSIAELEKKIADLQSQVKKLQGSYDNFTTYAYRQFIELFSARHPTVEFDPSSPGSYQLIDSSIGLLLISLDNAEPYLDGYNAQLEIGNITGASLQGFKLSAKWAKRYKAEDNNYIEWLNKRKSKDYSFTGALLSGRWNIFHIILPDTKPSEFGYLEVSIETNTVSLSKSQVSQ